jgi:cobalt/nickel transport system ATP-binding protein
VQTPLFVAGDITFRYAAREALDGLSLTIEAGERVALLGANGSGKSTLLRVLDALLFPDAGTLHFRGDLLTEEAFSEDEFAYAFRRRVGFVFQNSDAQLFNTTVFDEVAFGPLQLRLDRSEVRRRVEQTIERFQISHLADRAPHQLSGGEKKKVALASVLVLDPDVLLLDEPTAGLDPRSQTQLLDMLDDWQQRSGAAGQAKTIVAATHDLHTLEDVASRCLVMERGCVIASGSPGEILSDRNLLERSNLVHAHRHRAHHTHPHPGLHREHPD